MELNYEQLRTLLRDYTQLHVRRSQAKHGWTGWQERRTVEAAITEMLLDDLASAITDNRPHLYLDMLIQRWQELMAEEYERGEQVASDLPEEVTA